MDRVDLSLALDGYLRSPDGRRTRHVLGLDRIARDTLSAGATVLWADTPNNNAGHCLCDAGVILLAPWLINCRPWFIRDVWSHELAHILVGPSQHRARLWQWLRYAWPAPTPKPQPLAMLSEEPPAGM